MVDRIARATGPAALALFVVIGIRVSPQPLALTLAAGVVAVAVSVVLAVRSSEGWPAFAGTATATAGVAVICSGSGTANLAWFALCVLCGWCALRAGPAQALLLCGGTLVFLVVELQLQEEESGWGAWIVGTIFTTVVCLLTRRQRELVGQLRAAQAGLADRARLEERARIAREMHDVVGHALTVSLLHVASARLALDEDPEEAKASLAEAERLGRNSLAEVRQAVGMLREPGHGLVAPLPAGGQLDELVESFRRAGLTVTYEVVGDPSQLTANGGLTVYRIMQEALTNVVRHAPGAAALVRVDVRPDGTSLSVVNAAERRVGGCEGGTGVLGMRERAEAVGGRLTAGPSPDGWRVAAELPVNLAPVSAGLR